MTYQTDVVSDAPYIYIPFTSNSIANQGGTKTGMTQTSSGSSFGTGPTALGTMLTLSGSTSYVQYTVGTENMFNAAYSAEFWMKGAPNVNYQNIIHREELNNKIAIRIDATGSTYSNKLTMEYRGATGASMVIVGPVVTDNVWHHIVVTDDRTNVRLYVDGALFATTASNTAASFTNSTWRIGAYGTGAGNENFAGSVDEVALYKTTLSATRVTAHYLSGGGTLNVRPVATAAALSTAAPAPVIRFGKNVQAPASALSTSAPAPNVKIDYTTQTLRSVADGFNNGGAWSATATTLQSPSYIKFEDVYLPDGLVVQSAVLHVTKTQSTNPIVAIARNTQDWSEASTDTFPATTSDGDANVVAGTGAGTLALDVTKTVKAWYNAGQPNYGLRLTASSGTWTIGARENATVASRPYLTVTLAAPVVGPEVRNVAPAAALSTAAPAVTVKAYRTVSNAAPVAVLGTETITPVVRATTTAKATAPVITTAISAPGGLAKNPDYRAFAGVAGSTLVAPDAKGSLSYPIKVTVSGAAELSTQSYASSINLTTNRLNKANAATSTITVPGIYKKEFDRYYLAVPATIDADDIWYQMEETSGTVATDAVTSAVGISPTNAQNGTYVGGPTFQVPGPYLRKAVHFDGINDYLLVGGTAGYGSQSGSSPTLYDAMPASIELSVSTSQANGTLWMGGAFGGSNANQYGNAVEVRLVDGEMNFYYQGNYVFRVRKNIADGQWHHIVVSFPGQNLPVDPNDPDARNGALPFYVMIDGTREFTRYALPFRAVDLLPYTVMAKSTHGTNGPTGLGNFLAADMRDLIVRLASTLVTATAQKLYYEWSNATISRADVVTTSVATVDPAKARGNSKRMVMVYGLPWDVQYTGVSVHEKYNYYSNLGGFVIDTFAQYTNTATGKRDAQGAVSPGTDPFGGNYYYEPKPFVLEGFLVYPVSIRGDMPGAFGPRSAPGLLKSDLSVDLQTGNLVDDETGLPRWINLQTDLAEPIENFDAVTVVNYPWDKPFDSGQSTNRPNRVVTGLQDFGSGYQNAAPFQRSYGLTDSEWAQARNEFRDSILEASYSGVHLWVTEYYMAQHLGFVESIDKHSPGYFAGSQNPGDHIGYNLEAQRLDIAHLKPGALNETAGWVGVGGGGDYYSYYQMNDRRRIVALEPGLTDLPSNEYGAIVEGYPYDEYVPNGYFLAYDIDEKPNGLQLGDLTRMSMYNWYPGKPQGGFDQNTRAEVISAKPQGIAGKVIAREMEFFFGPGGIKIDNPYKNNAITIIAERGTVVRGRPIAGRAFMEFMDTDLYIAHIAEDIDKTRWKGSPSSSGQISFWDYDGRRNKEILVDVTSYINKFNSDTGQFEARSITQRYIQYVEGNKTYKPYRSMNNRGLNWLASAEDAPSAGSVKVYAAPAELSTTAPTPNVSKTRNINVQVTPAVMDVEVRQPRNFRDGNVHEVARPVLTSIEAMGLGKRIKVTPVETGIVTPNATVTGSGDKITVYIDSDRTITVFLKEDN